MDLKGIMVSEISQRKIPYDFIYMWNLKTTNEKTEQKQAHKYREQIGGCQREVREGDRKNGRGVGMGRVRMSKSQE